MAITKYLLKIRSTNTSFIISYKNGNWFRLEVKAKGTLKENNRNRIMTVIPDKEFNIDMMSEQYSTTISYEKVPGKEPSLHALFVGVYIHFYELKTKKPPRINKAEGSAIKQLINHFRSITENDDEALKSFRKLLRDDWDLLEPFYQKQIDIKQINSNINTLIHQVSSGEKKPNINDKFSKYQSQLKK